MPNLLGTRTAQGNILGRNNFVPSSLSIQSAPASVRRGQSYTISAFGVGTNLGNISADLDGAPVTVTAADGSTVTITIPPGINKKHSIQGYPLRLTVVGVGSVTSAPISLLPPVGFQFVDLVNPRNDEFSLTRVMLDQNGQTVQAATGDQIVAPELVNGRPLQLFPHNTFQIDVQGLAGDYSFSAYMIDANGIVGATALHTVTSQIGADVTPNAFDLGARTGIALNATNVESDVITVADVDPGEDVAISVTGGQYRVSTDGGTTWGAWTSAATTVQNDYRVQARGNAAGTHSAVTNVVLTIGGVSDTFTITTLAAPTATPSLSIAAVQSVNDRTITVTATPVNFTGQVTVEFLQKRATFAEAPVVVGTSSAPPYQYVHNTATAPGQIPYEYTARVGAVVSAPVEVRVDWRPQVYLLGPSTTQSGRFRVNFVFSETGVAGLTQADFVVVNGVVDTFAVDASGGSFFVTPTADFVGNVTVALPENTCQDANGNGNIASATLSVTVNTLPADVTRPVVTLVPPTGMQTGAATFLVEISETVTGLTAADFTLTNCTFVSLQQPAVAGGLLYSLTVAPPQNQVGSLSVAVVANAVQDAAGNTSLAVAPVAVGFDTRVQSAGRPPAIGAAIPDAAPWAVGSPFSYTVPGNAFTQGDGGAVTLTARQLGNQPLPAGMTFAGNTFSWPVPVIGRYQIEVVATDLLGLTESQVFVLDVVGQQTQASVRLLNRNGVAQPGRVVDWVIRNAWTGPAILSGTATSDGQGRILLSQYLNAGEYWFFGKEAGDDGVTVTTKVVFQAAA